MRRLLKEATSLVPGARPDSVPPEELQQFSLMKAAGARLYNRAACLLKKQDRLSEVLGDRHLSPLMTATPHPICVNRPVMTA